MSFMYILPSKHLAVFTFFSGDTKILIHRAGHWDRALSEKAPLTEKIQKVVFNVPP